MILEKVKRWYRGKRMQVWTQTAPNTLILRRVCNAFPHSYTHLVSYISYSISRWDTDHWPDPILVLKHWNVRGNRHHFIRRVPGTLWGTRVTWYWYPLYWKVKSATNSFQRWMMSSYPIPYKCFHLRNHAPLRQKSLPSHYLKHCLIGQSNATLVKSDGSATLQQILD